MSNQATIVEETLIVLSMEPQTGYYRVPRDHTQYKDRGFIEGTLVYAYVGRDDITVYFVDCHFTYHRNEPTSMERFHSFFKFEPNGAAERQAQISDLMQEIAEADQQLAAVQTQAISFSPHVEQTGELSTETALVPRGTSMAKTKVMVANIRNNAMKLKKDMAIKSKKLQALISEQSRAEAKVDELIKWWKFKNRTHRALLSDDAKVISMIVDEFDIRRKQSEIREKTVAVHDLIRGVLGAQEPAPILIAHKSNNQYVAYVPHNSHNVWVTEQTWVHNRATGNVKLKEAKEWKLVDKRHERWEIIYKHERWDGWRINPMMSAVLTDHEINNLFDQALESLSNPTGTLRLTQSH